MDLLKKSDKEILECPRIFIEVDSGVEVTINEVFLRSETKTLKLPVTEIKILEGSRVFHNLAFQSSFNENNLIPFEFNFKNLPRSIPERLPICTYQSFELLRLLTKYIDGTAPNPWPTVAPPVALPVYFDTEIPAVVFTE